MKETHELLKEYQAKRQRESIKARKKNKNTKLDHYRRQYSTENAKTGQTTVKTQIFVDSEASDTEFRAELLSKWGVKTTDSTPNPNDAFRKKKGKKMSVLEYLDQTFEATKELLEKKVDR